MPAPNTTLGGLMGYASTVDTGAAAPLIVSTPGLENATSTTAVVAGKAYASLFAIYAPTLITQMRTWISGSPTGNVDMGIYDSTGTNGGPNNLLGHTGAIAAAGGLFTKNLTANLLLSPGNYWMAIVDNAADSFASRIVTLAGMGPLVITSSGGLGSLAGTFPALVDANLLIAVYALTSGGYS